MVRLWFSVCFVDLTCTNEMLRGGIVTPPNNEIAGCDIRQFTISCLHDDNLASVIDFPITVTNPAELIPASP